MKEKINGTELLKETCSLLGIDLVQLVAKTAIWAPVEVVAELQKDVNNPHAVWFKNTCRTRERHLRRTTDVNGAYLDENTKANTAIKTAIGKCVVPNTFVTCHIY